MPGGVDITAAGGTPQPNNGLKPLINVIDLYQKKLNTVAKAIEDAAEASGATGGGPKAPEVLGPKTQEAINRLDRVIDKVAAAMDARDRASAKESKVISTEAANPTFDGLTRIMEATGEANKAANAYADSLKELGKAQQEFKDAQEADKQKPPAPQPAVDMRPNEALDDFFNTPLSDLKGPPPVQNADPRYNPDLDAALGIVTPPQPLPPPPPQPAPTGPTYLRPMPTGPVPYPFPQGAVQPPAPLPAATPVTTPVVTPPPATPVMPALTTGASGPVPVSIVNPLPVPVEGMTAPAPAPAAPVEPPKEKDDGPSLVGTLSGFTKALKGPSLYLRALEEVAKAVSIALEPLDEAFSALGKAIEPIANAVGTLLKVVLAPIMGALKVVGSLFKLLMSPLKIITALIDGFATIIGAIADVIESISTPLEIVAIQIEMIAEVFASIFGNVATIAKAMKAPQVAIQDAFKNVKSTIADLLINPMGAIPDLMSRIREAIDTFNPGAMIEFDLAMRDLMAVFGEALLPVVKIVTGVIRKFADTLRPILQKLEPVFLKLANTIGNFLLMNIDKFADAIKNMLPLLEMYMNRMQMDLQFKKEKQEAATMKADPLSETLKRAATAMAPQKGMLGGTFDRRNEAVRIEWDIKVPMMKEIDALKKQGLGEESPEIKKKMGELEALGKLQDKMFNDPASNKRAEFLKAVPTDEASKDAKYMEAKNKADVAAATLETKAKAGVKPSDLGPAMKDLADSLDGLDNEMTRMVAAQTGKGSAQGLAAAQNPAFKSIADLSRDTILKAFTATSSQAQMKEQQNKKAVDNVANLPAIILQGVQAGMKAAMDIQNGVAAAPPIPPALPAPAVAR